MSESMLPFLITDGEGNKFMLDDFQQVLDMKKALNKQWISVKDDLPRIPEHKDSQLVIIAYKTRNGFAVSQTWFDKEYGFSTDIAYWQPLPEPPKEKA